MRKSVKEKSFFVIGVRDKTSLIFDLKVTVTSLFCSIFLDKLNSVKTESLIARKKCFEQSQKWGDQEVLAFVFESQYGLACF